MITETPEAFSLNLSKHLRAAEKAHLKLGLMNISLVSRASEVQTLTPHPGCIVCGSDCPEDDVLCFEHRAFF